MKFCRSSGSIGRWLVPNARFYQVGVMEHTFFEKNSFEHTFFGGIVFYKHTLFGVFGQ